MSETNGTSTKVWNNLAIARLVHRGHWNRVFVFRGYRHHYVRRYSEYDMLPLQAQSKAIPDSLQRLEEEQSSQKLAIASMQRRVEFYDQALPLHGLAASKRKAMIQISVKSLR